MPNNEDAKLCDGRVVNLIFLAYEMYCHASQYTSERLDGCIDEKRHSSTSDNPDRLIFTCIIATHRNDTYRPLYNKILKRAK